MENVSNPAQVLRIEESQIGVCEFPPGSNRVLYSKWYGLVGPWCAMFVSWCLAASGLALNISTKRGFAYCPAGVQWFKKRGLWSNTPKIGSLVFFQFPGAEQRANHVGFVVGIGPGYIDTIEGNTDEAGGRTGGQVMYRRRSLAFVVGFGEPPYDQTLGQNFPLAAEQTFVAPENPWRQRVMAKPLLRRGDSGHDVRIMQALLTVHAPDLTAGSSWIDGSFGPNTEKVLRTWQTRTGVLTPDGVCGPATWAWLVGV